MSIHFLHTGCQMFSVDDYILFFSLPYSTAKLLLQKPSLKSFTGLQGDRTRLRMGKDLVGMLLCRRGFSTESRYTII